MDEYKKYSLLFWFLGITITYVNCDGQLYIMDQPTSMKFEDQRPLYTSELKYVFGTCLGYLDQDKREWQDLHIQQPFKFSEMIVVIVNVSNIKSINLPSLINITLMEDEPLDKTLQELDPETTTVFNTSILRPSVTRFDMDKNTDILPIDDVNPNPLVHAGYKLYDVIFKEIKNKKDKNISTLIWVNFPPFDEKNAEFYKAPFDSIGSAFKTFHELSTNFKDVKTIMAVIAHEGKITNTRRKRQIEAGTPTSAPEININSLNLAADYNENFPVIFNIMLWFSVSLLFSLIAICMVIASMDPGRDSIIYRMTSTRMKKDN